MNDSKNVAGQTSVTAQLAFMCVLYQKEPGHVQCHEYDLGIVAIDCVGPQGLPLSVPVRLVAAGLGCP